MATLQVRSIDERLYKALYKRAKADNRSISQEVIAILKSFLSQPASSYENATESFLQLAGSWKDSRPAEEIISEIDKSRSASRKIPAL